MNDVNTQAPVEETPVVETPAETTEEVVEAPVETVETPEAAA